MRKRLGKLRPFIGVIFLWLLILALLGCHDAFAGITADPKQLVLAVGDEDDSDLTTTTPADPRPKQEQKGGPDFEWSIANADGADPCSVDGSGTSATLTAGRTTAGLSKVRVQVEISWPGSSRKTVYNTVVKVIALGIQSQTVATAPDNTPNTRTTVGVAEQVDVTLVPTTIATVSWSVSGGGTLSSTTHNPTRFTAPESAANPSITAAYGGKRLHWHLTC